MKLRSTGKIADRFYVLGSPDVPVFLLDGAHPALFDAGFSAFAGLYEHDIGNILCGRAPEYLFLTHGHYDHIGAVRRLKAAWPRLKVVAHAKTVKILARNGALRAWRPGHLAARSTPTPSLTTLALPHQDSSPSHRMWPRGGPGTRR